MEVLVKIGVPPLSFGGDRVANDLSSGRIRGDGRKVDPPDMAVGAAVNHVHAPMAAEPR